MHDVTLLFVPDLHNKWWIIDAQSCEDLFHFTAKKQSSGDYGQYLVELVKTSQRTDLPSDTPWFKTRQKDGYARAYKRAFGRMHVVKGKDMYANFAPRSSFQLQQKKVKKEHQHTFGWEGASRHVLNTAGPDDFTVSSASARPGTPLAFGTISSENGDIGGINYGSLASLSFSSTSELWSQDRPTDLLDEIIFAILLIYTDRLVQSVAAVSPSLLPKLGAFYRDKARLAYEESHPECVLRDPASEVDLLSEKVPSSGESHHVISLGK